MSTGERFPLLVASFSNDELGLCANVHELANFEEHEVLVMDALSGGIVFMRTFPDKYRAVEAAKSIAGMIPS